MSLSDREILELSELCNAVVDETLTPTQRERLGRWLRASEEARQYYVRTLGLSASLFHYAGDMHSEASEARPAVSAGRPWLALGLALAASLAVAATLWFRAPPGPQPATPPVEYVARLTGLSAGPEGDASLHLGDRLPRGLKFKLARGSAEVTFDSGARVTLEGPSALELNSPWEGTLRRGALHAYVPPEAIGFRISHSSVDVVDLGTEFNMVADASGEADVLVLKGEVEAAPRSTGDSDSILLRAHESRRFASSGVSEVGDRQRMFARLDRPVALERFAPGVGYVHWRFDRAVDGRMPAEVLAVAPADYGMRLLDIPATGWAQALDRAAPRPALRFDGTVYAKASFPGISGNSQHTVAFWVRVPFNAQLSDAYAMVAWGTTSKKLLSHAVHIGWNRNPEEGPMGALRTDFGGGSAIGMTSLRDGHWHHVAVIFTPGEDPATPVQVKQYVDGKLESSATNPPGHTTRVSPSKEETPTNLRDVVWLGCRLGTMGQKHDRFRGEIGELFIANRGLEPNEIVRVMMENRLAPPLEVAAAAPRSF